MMTSRKSLIAGLALIAGALPLAAQAHPGDHSHMTMGMLAQHLMSQPFHMGWVAVLALAGGVGAWLLHAGGSR